MLCAFKLMLIVKWLVTRRSYTTLNRLPILLVVWGTIASCRLSIVLELLGILIAFSMLRSGILQVICIIRMLGGSEDSET